MDTRTNVYVQNLHKSASAGTGEDSGVNSMTSYFHTDTNDRFVNRLK